MNTIVLKDMVLTYFKDFRRSTTLDEFDDQYIWSRDQIINNELQYYLPKDGVITPFRLSNAGLGIVAEPIPLSYQHQYAHQQYTSGVLTSRTNSHSQLFGYWEISAKLPSAQGAWPAFWLLPTFDQWPDGIAVLGEIDIMEGVTDVLQGIYHGTMHTNESGKLVTSENNKISTGADLVNEYHRYGLAWTPEYLIWFFDGVEVRRLATPRDMLLEPRHFLLNLAVGGWGGTPDPADYPSKASFDIEYVSVYELPEWLKVNVDDAIARVDTAFPSGAPITPDQAAQLGSFNLPGDSVYRLNDGRFVTRSDINLVTEYLIQLNR